MLSPIFRNIIIIICLKIGAYNYMPILGQMVGQFFANALKHCNNLSDLRTLLARPESPLVETK